MPRFATKPEVFPPVVPAVNDRGDVPTYAFSDCGIVLAWTHPDGLGGERDYRGLGYQITAEKRVSIEVDAYFERPNKSAHDQAIAAVEAEIARLRYVHANLLEFTGVITRREDSVAPLTVCGVDGIWQVIGCDVVGEKQKPHDFSFRREHVFLPHAISPTKSKVINLNVVPPDGLADYPIQEALACWRGAFTARVPAPNDRDCAAWHLDLGLTLTGVTTTALRGSDCDAGYMDPDRLGGDVRVEILPPQRRGTLDVERDLAESLRLASHEVRHPITVEVTSRDVRGDGSKLAVVDGYEIVAGPTNPAENIFADEPDFEVDEEQLHPGVTTRVAYFALGDEWFTRLTITVGARVTDRLETWWLQACERLWVWVP